MVIPNMTMTLGPAHLTAHPPGSIVTTGEWIASWIARGAVLQSGYAEA